MNGHRPSKRTKLLSDNESGSDSEGSDGRNGVRLPDAGTDGFTINKDFAKRFEHNKKREEIHRLEEKYSGKGDRDGDDDEDSEDDESEDDDAELATEQLDAEIMDTLQAIKQKDPRVYDNNVKFYREFDPEKEAKGGKERKEKPMYLQDYHRANLLAGAAEDADAERAAAKVPRTYQQEQDQMRKELVGGMHAAAKEGDTLDLDDGDADDFLVAKAKPKHDDLPAAATKQRKRKRITDDDIATANQDPENYLSNFMAARAWLPSDTSGAGSRWQAFDSDDSDDERRADEFESAYNLRFEDPKTSNEKLQSFARDVGKYGVRRDDKSGRAKAREREKEQKEAEKRVREEERARLRKLKIEEAEEKINRIREAAGLSGKEVDLEQWRHIIEGDFDDAQWDDEMQRRFGDQYYAKQEGKEDSDEEMQDNSDGGKRNKVKKPKWNDDIDIHDLVPDFEDQDEKPDITLSDDDDDDDDEDQTEGGAPLPASDVAAEAEDDSENASSKPEKKTKKDRLQEKSNAKRVARKQRMKIEEMVDASLPLSHPAVASSSKNPVAGFRYRETSPTSFGLSARDILFADDKQLNEFAGLKKYHGFREEEKKKRDHKKFSKKARLRKWRMDTFGGAEEPKGGFERVLGAGGEGDGSAQGREREEKGNVREGERKGKKRSGKGKKKGKAGNA
ncbi:hypothetical protein B0A50_01915 [Salinomyces thailandicus]|uniref:Kri1-like C-terminal domain-containing protein n=1 Tax=Salinomyces thailandicus TaxID=706561 RepID=A0A4U0U7F1_9PEZI|nr:hypothetical protein B0A50_01915 [Salinomyces thailandica]